MIKPMHQLLLNRDIYDEVMLKRLPEARRFVWIVTADIKDLHLDTGFGFESLLALLSRLIEKGVVSHGSTSFPTSRSYDYH